ncbi:electron transfer flavoprotein subunit beta/FixA family protein [Phycicoccus sonneratiae]|uniref:Electron transfer flavoprotein subunit beta/FixA family protein n=1 Tax=Phycicoccus sonneratiae TaxID=2807628 RepID=A0ABS2CLQ6_9MICO|nr:electron transfer flavoprotein subunit beta/FixA family protein [Phycicoccus sonneraticus]MBM6400763.1 electron transfer flavoprotein subunit beta/FixA family protein [Phycicoccus sonneraticus]
MTNVLVCVKRVPDPTGEVVLTPDGLRVDGRFAGYTTSAHEEAAVALAVQLAEPSGGTVTVLSVGSEDSIEQIRSGIAVGATDGILVEADADLLGPADVASAIAEAVQGREAAGTGYDLVLLGNDAADTGDFQVGIRLSYLLDRPVVAGIQTVEVEGDRATLRGEGPEGTEVYEVDLPAVATVLEGGVAPRYPSVMGRMRAKKAEVETVAWSGTASGSGRDALTVPEPPPSEVTVLGEGPSAAPALVAVLRELKVVHG